MTIRDIAELAGVDKAVVSKVINNAKLIPASKEKIARVKAVIEEYGYTPSSSARSLVTSRTRQLLFLLSATTTQGIGNEVFAQSLSGVMEICRQKGYLCQIEMIDFSKIEKFILLENLRRRSVDGCILTGGFSPEALHGIASTGCPMVIIVEKYQIGNIGLQKLFQCPAGGIFFPHFILFACNMDLGCRECFFAVGSQKSADVIGMDVSNEYCSDFFRTDLQELQPAQQTAFSVAEPGIHQKTEIIFLCRTRKTFTDDLKESGISILYLGATDRKSLPGIRFA